MAVGQGDVQVTPLQLAVAYSALANDGYVVHPRIGLDIESPDGTVLQQLDRARRRATSAIDPTYLDAIRAGAARLPPRSRVARPPIFVLHVPRAGLRQDRHRPVHRASETTRGMRASWPSWATGKPILIVVTTSSRAASATSPPAGGAADALAVVLRQARLLSRPGARSRLMSVIADPAPRESPTSRDRAAPVAAIDPLLLLAAVGLVACSLVTLTRAPSGHRRYVDRQGLYAGDRAASLRAGRQRASTTRACASTGTSFYGLLIAAQRRSSTGCPPCTARTAGSRCQLLQFQSSEFGKLLLIVALAGVRGRIAAARAARAPHDRADHAARARSPRCVVIPPAGPRHRAWST